MKKSFLVLALLIAAVSVNAQTVEEIVKKNSVATGYDVLSKATSLYVEGRISQMGTELPLTIYVKQPDKIKVIMSYNGMEIITMYDGEKGYMINPLSGSFEPTEIPADQIESIKKNNMLLNPIEIALNENRLQYLGDEDVDSKPAYKLMASNGEKEPVYYFIDKENGLLVKTSTKVSQMGQEMTIDTYNSDFSDNNGYKFPKVSRSLANGTMEAAVIYYDKIEVNSNIEDSVFTL